MNQSRSLDFYISTSPLPTTFGSRFRSTVLPDGLKQKRLVRTSKTWKAWRCLTWMLGQRRERGIVRSPERVPGDRSTNSDPRNSQIQATSYRLTTWPRITPRTSRPSGVRSLRRHRLLIPSSGSIHVTDFSPCGACTATRTRRRTSQLSARRFVSH